MTKNILFKKITAAFLFAFGCAVFQSETAFAQLPPWVHTDQQVLPDQFESNDSLNEVDNEVENELVVVDSLQEQKISFANVDVPTYEDSIYQSRLGAIVTPVQLTYNDEVRKYIDLYVLNRRDQVSRMLGLSKIYFPIFDQIFVQYGVPPELKYLAIIESALNPHAISRCGAVGIWQFMYGTAKLYGLNMNSYVDERRDIIRSTEGAAQYLKNMYDVYGDWLLAVASYNCGAGNVNRAISLSGGNTFWEIRDYLPRETRNYVPAFIAATYVMNYYDLHDLEPVYPQYNFEAIASIDISDKMSCDQIAKFTGLSMDEFKFLNPGLKSNVIPGGPTCTYTCKLPCDKVLMFDEKKDSIVLLSKNAKTTYYSGFGSYDGARSTYTVRKGDNLGKIAAKYHVSVTQLKKWNHLSSSNIRVGQHLKLYSSHGSAAATASKTTTSKTHTTPAPAVKKPAAPATGNATASTGKPATQTSKYVYYKARSGDTLWDIAASHGTTVAEIRKLNGAAKCNNLKAGTVLKLSSKG